MQKNYNNNAHPFSQQHRSRESNDLNYTSLQEKKKREGYINTILWSKAVTTEAKYNRKYKNAELLFEELAEDLKSKPKKRSDYVYAVQDVHSFQRAICTLIRYAPNREKALSYITQLYHYEKPFRDVSVELIALTNLLYVHLQDGSQAAMNEALDLIKATIGVNIFSVYKNDKKEREFTNGFGDSTDVFETFARKVLRHFGLSLSLDKKVLISYSNRYQ